MKGTKTHIPVLLREAVSALAIEKGAWYIDATFGRGGHTNAILAAGGNVIAFDCDEDAVRSGQQQFERQLLHHECILVRDNFSNLEKHIIERQERGEINTIAGVLFDFGVSSPQLDTPERGFSFLVKAPLDMRMDTRLGVQAKDLLAILPERQLAELFREYGGEHEARVIAKAITTTRQRQPIETTEDLATLVEKTKREPRGKLHPATKVFQALRMAVNMELESITTALPQAFRVLRPSGRIVTISFHEGEDRIVKELFKKWQREGKGQQMNQDVVTPSPEEIAANPRSRSAKLRIFLKTK